MVRNRLTRLCLALTVVTAALLVSGCSGVVARVNGQDITRKEFHDQLEASSGLQVLQQTIINKLVLERAKAENCLPTAAEVQQKQTEYKQERFKGDQTEYTKFLKANGLDDKALLDAITLQLALFKLATKGVDASDAKLQQFFNEYHEKYFDKPERVSFRQIVLPSAEAAQAIISQLNQSDEMFAQLVAKESMDQATKENGGLVDGVSLDSIQKEAKPLYDVLQKLQKNQISQTPVKVQDRYLVVKLIDHMAAEKANLADPKTKELVKNAFLQLNGKKQEQVIAECGKGAQVVVLEERFKAPIESIFSQGGAAPGGAVPPDMQKQMEKGPDMAPPTHVDDTTAPPAKAPQGGAPKGAAPAAPKGGAAPAAPAAPAGPK